MRLFANQNELLRPLERRARGGRLPQHRLDVDDSGVQFGDIVAGQLAVVWAAVAGMVVDPNSGEKRLRLRQITQREFLGVLHHHAGTITAQRYDIVTNYDEGLKSLHPQAGTRIRLRRVLADKEHLGRQALFVQRTRRRRRKRGISIPCVSLPERENRRARAAFVLRGHRVALDAVVGLEELPDSFAKLARPLAVDDPDARTFRRARRRRGTCRGGATRRPPEARSAKAPTEGSSLWTAPSCPPVPRSVASLLPPPPSGGWGTRRRFRGR